MWTHLSDGRMVGGSMVLGCGDRPLVGRTGSKGVIDDNIGGRKCACWLYPVKKKRPRQDVSSKQNP